MSTATEYFGIAVTNLGPLTTTFTAAPACATQSNALRYASAPDGYPGYAPTCDYKPYGESCYPGASAWNSALSEARVKPTNGWAPYFSPGLVCPSGWTTVGTMARATSDTGPIATAAWNSSGALAGDFWSSAENVKPFYKEADFMPPLQVYQGVLHPEETLALCCPSGYNIKLLTNFCVSKVGDLDTVSGFDTICFTHYTETTHFNTIVTTKLPEMTQTHTIISAYTTAPIPPGQTTTMDTHDVFGSDHGNYEVVTMVPAVPLVYRASDLPTDQATKKNVAAPPASIGKGTMAFALVPLCMPFLGALAGAGLIL